MGKAMLAIVMLALANIPFAAAVSLTNTFSIEPGSVYDFNSNTNTGTKYYGLDVGDFDALTTVLKLTAQPASSTHDVTYGIAEVDFTGSTADITGATWITDTNSLTTLLLANTKYVLSVASETASNVHNQISAVPLPAAAWLFGSALAGFMVMSNRRRV